MAGLRAPAATAAGALVATVVALVVVHVLAAPRSGVLALTQVMEPFALVAALGVLPLAVWGRRRWQLIVSVALVLIVLVRYGPVLVSLPASGSGPGLRVASWNLLSGPESAARAVRGLATADLDLVGLQELIPAAATAIEAEVDLDARYPYRVLEPQSTVLGMGLLSRHPIVEQTAWSEPPLIRAVVEHGSLGVLTVFVAHPMPARIATFAGLPAALDTVRRDRDIAFIRSQIDADLARGANVVVLGDFNVTEREPAYADLARGMRDAHLDAGIGPGLTWRPSSLDDLPFGLLRIDYVFTSPTLRATSTHVDCGERSDHCLVVAVLHDTAP